MEKDGKEVADVAVVTMDESGCQCLYVNGRYVEHDSTIYACDIATAMGGQAFTLRALECEELCEHEEWPKELANLTMLDTES